MNDKWNRRYLDLAKLVASWSKDPSTKVGAVIVRPNKTVASVGFNGFPTRMPDKPEWYSNRDEKYSRIVHAEKNALIFAGGPVEGYVLYTYPCIPCDRCCVEMGQAGIGAIVAPLPSDDMQSRWAEAFAKSRRYCHDQGIELVELPILEGI